MHTTTPRSVLILGASYGSLLGARLALAGHDVTLVCLPEESAAINAEGICVRLPVRGREGLVEIDSRTTPGRVSALPPGEAMPAEHDLIALAMQEPQYRHRDVRALLERIGASGRPVMSIMNMPPLPFLARLPAIDMTAAAMASADPEVWAPISPEQITLASPDPQAFRPQGEGLNRLQVSLPTNFKVARFARAEDTALLRQLADDIEASRLVVDGEEIALPVKLKVHDSLFVPLAKWAMLLTGNYRCATPSGPRAIAEAVHQNIGLSREVYDFVCAVCIGLGATPSDLVPFDKYAAAAKGLAKPSSAARALYAGAPAIERVDRLVHALGEAQGLSHPEVDRTVALIDDRLSANRAAA